VYGFSLSFAFLVADYNGTPSLVSRFPFFVILSLFGAVCGLALSALGYYLKLRFTPSQNVI
jgi:NhaP-type Na+/H+ or K+/H+ antiporter